MYVLSVCYSYIAYYSKKRPIAPKTKMAHHSVSLSYTTNFCLWWLCGSLFSRSAVCNKVTNIGKRCRTLGGSKYFQHLSQCVVFIGVCSIRI